LKTSLAFATLAALLLLAPRPARADAAGGGPLPVRYVERPLTLPRGTLAPQFSVGDLHFEQTAYRTTVAVNAIGLDLGAAYGVSDDLSVDITPLTLLIGRSDVGSFGDTKVYYGTFRLGATYRFLHDAIADVGGRFEFGATGANDVIHLTGGVPVALRLGGLLRVDTGAYFTGLFPTKGASVDGAVAATGVGLPTVGAATGALGGTGGVPVSVSAQIVDAFWAGLDTGFGIASFRGSIDKNCFMPLGLHAGYTIGDKTPIADVVGAFAFPAFLLGADSSPPTTRLWSIGATVRAYLPL
jgi:hypothetical protein